MKRSILTSALLSLILLIAQPMRAQVKVLSSSFEVTKNNFLFKGQKTQFDLSGYILEINGSLGSSPAVAPSSSTNAIDLGGPMIFISALKNRLSIGSVAKPLYGIYATHVFVPGGTCESLSDLRYKTNIKNLSPALDKIMRLRPVKFDYLEEKEDTSSLDSTRMNRVGLIAQELEKEIPEVVRHLLPEDIYAVDYGLLIPFLIKSIQEQQALIENQQLQIEELQLALMPDNAAMVTPTFSNAPLNGNATETMEAVGNKLWSNVPNPFKRETHIRYALTENVREAQLCIYDLSGKQLSCHRLNDRGESEFVLRAAALNPGIYLYSLIADGQVVDTHRMVVTE